MTAEVLQSLIPGVSRAPAVVVFKVRTWNIGYGLGVPDCNVHNVQRLQTGLRRSMAHALYPKEMDFIRGTSCTRQSTPHWTISRCPAQQSVSLPSGNWSKRSNKQATIRPEIHPLTKQHHAALSSPEVCPTKDSTSEE